MNILLDTNVLLDAIVTRDKDFTATTIPVLTPTELMAQLSAR